MKAVKLVHKFSLILMCGLIFSLAGFAQTENPKKRERLAKAENQPNKTEKTAKAEKTEKADVQKSDEDKTAVVPQTDEKKADDETEAAILPYYQNYLSDYRLGPNDIISVEVFGQCPDYCVVGKTVPPNATLSYPLIREGVFVGGKTTLEIQDEITERLNEYIIDPKVNVTLEKAGSARYSVLGKVVSPGVRIMDRKVSLYEAIVESGGVLKDGDKKRVTLFRYDQQGRLSQQSVNLLEIERGKGDMIFLQPGDQVFVPDEGFKFNLNTVFKVLERASIVRLFLGSPF